MKPDIVEVRTKHQLRQFIDFPETLYRDCPKWVPPIRQDEYDTLGGNNAAMEYCDLKMFLALDGRKVVGRVAGIINRDANFKWGERVVRFGWIEFIEDREVAGALVEAVKDWGRFRGMNQIKGPLGFTDLDREGLLVDGFENLSSFTCIYNFAYYPRILEEIGFSKDADWTQYILKVPKEAPPMFKYADVVSDRLGLRVMQVESTRDLAREHGKEIFRLYNEAFKTLYEFAPLSDRQIERYVKTYVSIMDPDFVCCLQNREGKLVGFAFCVPSISRAVKKVGGKLFPLGLLEIGKALKENDTVEALLIGLLPEYQGKGANVLMFKHLYENCLRRGIRRVITNPQLELNLRAQTMWGQFDPHEYMCRRSYVMNLA